MRYFKIIKQVNNGEKTFKDFVDHIYKRTNDWAEVLAARKIFIEDGGDADKVIVDWDVKFPDGITINTLF